jgi:hypothetical protein
MTQTPYGSLLRPPSGCSTIPKRVDDPLSLRADLIILPGEFSTRDKQLSGYDLEG